MLGRCLIDGKSPANILKFGFGKNEGGLHEAQKPVELLEHLIKLVTRKNQSWNRSIYWFWLYSCCSKKSQSQIYRFWDVGEILRYGRKRLTGNLQITQKITSKKAIKPPYFNLAIFLIWTILLSSFSLLIRRVIASWWESFLISHILFLR